MQVAIYARVSTTNGQDPTVQTRELREYVERRPGRSQLSMLMWASPARRKSARSLTVSWPTLIGAASML